MKAIEKTSGERGSALLIVFVFAAIVAISLYMELPVAAFEAQRDKEQLLVDRGDEYAHAVKLFVRSVKHYPTSVRDLEETNRMRFLRNQYVDPFTGKKDWRLLHAGPGGQITDSKVKQPLNPFAPGGQNGSGNNSNQGSNQGAATGTTSFGGQSGGSSGFGSSFGGSNNGQNGASNSGFGSSQSASGAPAPIDSAASSTPPEVMVQQPRQRGPAVAASGASNSAAGETDTSLPPLPNPDAAAGTAAKPANTAGNTAAGVSNAPSGAGTQGQGTNDANLKTSMLNASGARSQLGGPSSGSSQFGVLNTGGLAGVASKAGGRSIKTVNDQSDYSLWEFYYDPRKDTVPGGAQAGNFAQGNGVAGGQTNGAAQPSSGFGQNSGQSSGFGQNSSGNGQQSSGFGQNSSGNGQQSSGFGQNSNGNGQQSSGFGQNSSGNGQQSSGFGQSSFGNNSNGSSFGQNSNNQTQQNPGQNSNPQ